METVLFELEITPMVGSVFHLNLDERPCQLGLSSQLFQRSQMVAAWKVFFQLQQVVYGLEAALFLKFGD